MSGLVISGGVLELGGTSFGSGAITFAAPGGIAHFTPGSTALSNVISGLDAGDSLYFDATPVNFSPVAFGVTDTATLSGSTQLHAVLNGTTYNFTLADLSPGVSFDVVPIAVGFLGNPTFPFATAINAVSATSVTTTLSNTTVTLGQAERVLGTTLNISVGTGGEQTVKNGGRTSNTTIDSGGWQLVSSGGTATGAIDNGIQFIFAGGSASNTSVGAAGMQGVNGTAVSTTVIGIQDVGAGGKASATTIASGGLQNVFSGGTVTRTIDQWSQEILSGGQHDGRQRFPGRQRCRAEHHRAERRHAIRRGWRQGEQYDRRQRRVAVCLARRHRVRHNHRRRHADLVQHRGVQWGDQIRRPGRPAGARRHVARQCHQRVCPRRHHRSFPVRLHQWR